MLALVLICLATVFAQSRQGELRLQVTDAAGYGVKSSVVSSSSRSSSPEHLQTDETGLLVLRHLDFAKYSLTVSAPGFTTRAAQIAVNSEVPQVIILALRASAAATTVEVVAPPNDTDAGNTYSLAKSALDEHIASAAGRGIVDAVNAQPGWLVEANGTLHARGSEYGIQFVQDGFPFNDNRSPAFSSSPNPEEAESLSVMTAGFPAEFGRKLSGVVETNSARRDTGGFHGRLMMEGGSFGDVEESAEGRWSTSKQAIKLGISGLRTDRYLDPPTLVALNDSATNINESADYDRELTKADSLRLAVWHGGSRFFVPNDLVQQNAGQSQIRENSETGGNISLNHTFSPRLLGSLRAMARDLAATLDSTAASTPIVPFQDRGFREVYVSASLAGQKRRHNWKVGADLLNTNVRENFSYSITDPTQFDPGTAAQFSFAYARTSRERAAFAQDNFALGRLTASLGIRWDSYRFLVNDNAFSPRIGMGWQAPKIDATFYASYDRVFATPAIENLLVSSSTAAQRLTGAATGLPVHPATGDYYQAGVRKLWTGKLMVNANYFVRDVRNFFDDDLLLNTGVSFPISFSRARIHGWETKIETRTTGRFSASVSYSNQVGVGMLPITGGLLLEGGAQTLRQSASRFPISQDQRNTLHTSARYRVWKESWISSDTYYGSGLPIEVDSANLSELSAQFSPILSKVNLEKGRVRPSASIDIAAGTTLWSHDYRAVQLQASAENIFDRLNVINFAGVLSGTAIGAPRHYGARLRFSF